MTAKRYSLCFPCLFFILALERNIISVDKYKYYVLNLTENGEVFNNFIKGGLMINAGCGGTVAS